MNQIEQAKVIGDHIRSVIGNEEATTPNTSENISRDRLLRVKTGLCHVLTEVIPAIPQCASRDELVAWIFEIHTIAAAEECQMKPEVTA
ncbi:transcriptional regulator [Citrobacter telavivensis]